MTSDTDPTITTEGPPAEAAGEDSAASAGAPHGSTWIADSIVAKVAGAAAREVEGVEDLRSGGARRGWTRPAERRRGGASVRVTDGSAAIEVRLVVRDGVEIPRIVEDVRARITERVEFATGMRVTTVDVGVVDVVPPPAPQMSEPGPDEVGETPG